jgi:hypothetical protein
MLNTLDDNEWYAYSNFCVEYAFHAIPHQIRPHAYIHVLLVAGSYRWQLVLLLWVTNGVLKYNNFTQLYMLSGFYTVHACAHKAPLNPNYWAY